MNLSHRKYLEGRGGSWVCSPRNSDSKESKAWDGIILPDYWEVSDGLKRSGGDHQRSEGDF